MIQGLEGAELLGDPDVEIAGMEYDSRMIKQDFLFFAIKGFKVDGYDFIDQARDNGAIAVLGDREDGGSIANYIRVPDARKGMADAAARFYGYPGRKIKACGVTGTNGKTTTCFLIRSILESRNKATGLVTTQLYDTGREKFEGERTTPDSLDMQRLLYLMKRNLCVNAVIEVSSHALTQHRVDNINFRVAVYTNLTRDHLDYHSSMEEYFQAKAELARRVDGPLSYVVINLDVPEFRPLFGAVNSAFMAYSLDNQQADVYCGDRELKSGGTVFDLVTPMGTRTVNLRLPGRFNLMNALAAATAGLAAGVDLDSVVRGLDNGEPVPGRLNPVNAGQPFGVYVDFAHTPDAITRLCETAREFCEERLLLMFGCGGDRDKGKRPLMGQAAIAGADQVVITSDNPRSEDPARIIKDIKAGIKKSEFVEEPDRATAIRTIMKLAKPGDVVLLAGKGAEKYQDIAGEKHPFNDVEQAQAALQELGFQPLKMDERA